MRWDDVRVKFHCSSDQCTQSQLYILLKGRTVANKVKVKGIFRRDEPRLYEGLGLGSIHNGGRMLGPTVQVKDFHSWKTKTHLIYRHTDNVYYFLRIL